ncbi:selenocysteine-specific elongation factor, partial [Streptomyces sp. SID8385]|nr:selenocysteine-specific elongation factor [Streptomyces sp. SID8385]
DPADPAIRLRATGCELRADLAAMGFATADPEARPEARSENLAAGPFVVDAAHAAWLRAALTAEVDRYAAA